MANPLETTSILYFLILPTIIGMGIDTRYGHRYAIAALFGLIFFLFCSFWYIFGPASSLYEIEPMIILILLGMSMFVICKIFERKSDTGVLQRNALMFLAISIAGLPLYMVKNIVEGRTSLDFPASLLPLLQFTLVLFALVVVANALEARIYAKKEGRISDEHRFEGDDELDLQNEEKYELKTGLSFYKADRMDAQSGKAEWEDMDPDYYMDEFQK